MRKLNNERWIRYSTQLHFTSGLIENFIGIKLSAMNSELKCWPGSPCCGLNKQDQGKTLDSY